MPERIAIDPAAAMAVAIWVRMVVTWPITSRTSITELDANPASTALLTARSFTSASAMPLSETVAARLCGASRNVLGLNTIT